MKPSTRWTILILVVVVIGIIWLLWPKAEQPPAKPVVTQPAPPKPEPAPAVVTPKPEAPVTATIYFDFDQSVVRPGEAPKLDDFGARVKGRSFERIEVAGHADRIGADAYNVGLSKRRADAVQAYLAGKGLDAVRVRAEAKGESEAVTGDACKDLGPESRKNRKLVECLQRDRRAEIRLVAGR